MEKLAIIDMGSNSIRFVVMQIADNQSYSLLYQEKEAINFGSQIRTYTLQPYRLIKDHRTGTEDTDVDRVLDGDLDKFIHNLLLYRHVGKKA